MSGFPETSGFAMVLKRAGQALVLSGESARQAGSILENMEEHSLACRVSDLIRVLDVFAHAPQMNPIRWLRPDTIRLYAVVRNVWSMMPSSTFHRI